MSNLQYLPKSSGLLEALRRGLRRLYYRPYLKVMGSKDVISNYSVLEVGCGPGYFLEALDNWSSIKKLTAIDVEAALVKHSQTRVTSAEFKELSAENVALIQDKFDIVFSFQVIEHLEDPIIFFRELRKILNQNAKVVLTTPNPESIAASLMKSKWHGIREDHVSVLSRKDWLSVFERAGYEVEICGSTFLNGIPILGRGIFALPIYFLQLVFGWLPWSLGESHVFIIRKP